MRTSRLLLSSAFACTFLLSSASAQTPVAAPIPEHWVGTWATASLPYGNKDLATFVADTTLREIVHTSIGGSSIRVVLTNEQGNGPLTIGAAQVALGKVDGSIKPDTAATLTFSGHPSIIIPPGSVAYSDPVPFKLPALADLTLSLFIPAQSIHVITTHPAAFTNSYEAPDNQVGATTLNSPKNIGMWRFIKSVDVNAPASSFAIVTLGDSITDGSASSTNANARWPDVLARRLQADPSTNTIGVLNVGIGGNRILHDNAGPSALSRFDHDVLAQSGVKYLIILESINDIGRSFTPGGENVITADQLIAAFDQMITRAHTHGIKVIGATLTPFTGAGYYSPLGESQRQAVNKFIRSSKKFDGVIDFEAVTQDPANPGQFISGYNKGDHLHPDDAGYKAMGDAIDLKLFSK